jgi:hypothetical protein
MAPARANFDDLRDGRTLLADRHVDAGDVATALVHDRIERDGGLTGLPVADDGSRWPRPIGIIVSIALMPVCSGSFTGWRDTMPGALSSMRRFSVLDRTFAVDGQAERVHDDRVALTDRDLGDAARASDLVTFADRSRLAEQNGADVVLSRFSTIPKMSCGNWRSSPAAALSSP